MKILIVSSQTPEKSSTFVKNQFVYLNTDHILHSGFRPYIYKGKSIFKFPLNINILRAAVKRLTPFLYTKLYDSALTRFLCINKFDAVLGNYGTQSSNIALACYRANTPLVPHFHGYDAYMHNILKEYKSRYDFLFKTAFRIVVVSKDMKTQLVTLGAPENKIVVNSCGVDTNFFSQCNPALNSNQLIFVGRFTEKKAPDLLLKAFHRALQKVPDAKLVMIGGGDLVDLVQTTIKDLNISESVSLLGWQPSSVIATEMSKSRAYVQHSKFAANGDSEGTPVSVLEASCCGLPIISTKHAGIKEAVLHERTGYLVEEGDWETMGDFMVELLKSPELASKMGAEARTHILNNYDIRNQMNKLSQTLREGV